MQKHQSPLHDDEPKWDGPSLEIEHLLGVELFLATAHQPAQAAVYFP